MNKRNEHTNDVLFKQLAKKAAIEEGRAYQKELDEANRAVPEAEVFKLDKKVARRLRWIRFRRYRKQFALAAAVLLVFVMVRPLFKNDNDVADNSAPPASSSMHEVILLSAELPPDFTVSETEQDGEMTVYYLAHAALDDVVLTLKMADKMDDYSGLEPILIGQTLAYGRSTNDYQIIKFEKEGIVYDITCRYEMNTIIALSASILI